MQNSFKSCRPENVSIPFKVSQSEVVTECNQLYFYVTWLRCFWNSWAHTLLSKPRVPPKAAVGHEVCYISLLVLMNRSNQTMSAIF